MTSEEDQPDWVDWEDLLQDRQRQGYSLSWLSLRALASSANDVLGKMASQLVTDLRSRWVAGARRTDADGRWDDDFVISMPGVRSFVVVGDTGEQDSSQYAVVPALVAEHDAAFMVICSDVIYPAGDINDYVDGFYRPYEKVAMPIFAVPGNHDWYDGLNGFMWHFCDASALPVEAYDVWSYRWRARFARLLWRKPSAPRYDVLQSWRRHRAVSTGEDTWRARQPGPYFAIDLEQLLVVCIDTGIDGTLDWEQGEWLARISCERRQPKLLLTGKPLMVDHRHERCEIASDPDGKPPAFPNVDAIVRKPDHGYVAAIGGDIHNFQHYPVTLTDAESGRTGTFHYVVSGGGGAFMSATHAIPLDEPHGFEGIDVDGFACYPTRRQSLAFYSERLVRVLWKIVLATSLVCAGVGLGALVDPGGAVAAVAAGVLALWLAFVYPGLGALRPKGARHWRLSGAALLAGVTGSFAGHWLVGGDFGFALVIVGGLVLVGAVVARALRWSGSWQTTAGKIVAYGSQALFVLGAFVALIDHVDPAGGPWRVALVFVATILVLVALPIAVDWAQRVVGGGYQWWLVGAGAVVIAGLAVLGHETGSWVPRAVVAAALLTAAFVTGVVIAHLVFLGAFSLLWRPGDHDGVLTPAEAEAAIDWRAGRPGAAPADRTKRITNLVHPGSNLPNGPLQKKVSEVCDRDRPPFHKNFLRIDIGDAGMLTITPKAATGLEKGPGDVKPASLPIPVDPAAQWVSG